MLCFVTDEQCAGQSIIWDFSTPVTTGPGGHRIPAGWRVFVAPGGDTDGTWVFVNASSSNGGSASAAGGGDGGHLRFDNPNDPPNGGPDVDSSLFTPSFRFTDISRSLISILGVDFFNGVGVPETDRIEFSLVRKAGEADENDDEGILLLNATPDTSSSPPLDAQLPVSQLGVTTQDYYRIRIRAHDMDAFQSMGCTIIQDIAVANAVLETANPDYNRDGVVNAADYVVWRKALGTSDLRGDGDGDGFVNFEDYQFLVLAIAGGAMKLWIHFVRNGSD